MNVGERIKSKRLELGMSQDELAKKCGGHGSDSRHQLERKTPKSPVKSRDSGFFVVMNYDAF